tara:strand:- start:164 stop:541 length:378 start_codon:yes stop_codon:yes gene_type:complete
MQGISPALPLTIDETDGLFKLNKTTKEVARQNLKMLILTSPGERVMNPDFGVGARQFLFENLADMDGLYGAILNQASVYLPFIEIISLQITPPGDGEGENPNTLQIGIEYRILQSSEFDFFNMEL